MLQNIRPLLVYIRLWNSASIKLTVNKQDTVGQIKEFASTLFGYHKQDLSLYYSGNRLQDQVSISTADIKQNSIIHLNVKQRKQLSQIQIYYHHDRLTRKITVQATDTVRELKLKIHQIIKLQPQLFVLSHCGYFLHNLDKTLADYQLQEQASIIVVDVRRNIQDRKEEGTLFKKAKEVQSINESQELQTIQIEQTTPPVCRMTRSLKVKKIFQQPQIDLKQLKNRKSVQQKI